METGKSEVVIELRNRKSIAATGKSKLEIRKSAIGDARSALECGSEAAAFTVAVALQGGVEPPHSKAPPAR
jgi:hypothetical protein